MSQNDFNLANQGFPSMRSDINSALQALASNSSGATAPTTTYAYQFWYDTTTRTLKIRNSANSAWIDFLSSAAEGVPSYRYVSTVPFTASGTFTKASYPWLRAIRVRVQAGGGGGRGPSSTANQLAAGGGGAGGYSEEFILASSLGASETVTVGAGGAGGAAGGNSGVAGNSSSFGSFCSATGGAGGANNGGAGGVGSGGDINASGGNGGHRQIAENLVAYSGHGGSSLLSGGGFGRFTAVAGGDGLLGSGGGAGFNNTAGGDGGTGIVIVELFA